MLLQNAKYLTLTVIDSKAIEAEDEDFCAPANINVSYDTSKARNWGSKLGDKYENNIFKRAAEDCMKFCLSMCMGRIWQS